MAGNRDPQRRPVLYDLKNQRFLADPAIGSTYYPINLGSGYLTTADIGVTVQGYDATLLNAADIGVTVQGYDATLLNTADIGVTVQGYDADTAKLDVAQSFTALQTFSAGVDLAGSSYQQTPVSVPALNIDCSAGNYFTKSISANSTFTFSNVPASRVYSFTLELTHVSGTVTWPAAVKWPNDTAPVLATGKTHLFVFITDDSGSRWRGASLVNYVN